MASKLIHTKTHRGDLRKVKRTSSHPEPPEPSQPLPPSESLKWGWGGLAILGGPEPPSSGGLVINLILGVGCGLGGGVERFVSGFWGHEHPPLYPPSDHSACTPRLGEGCGGLAAVPALLFARLRRAKSLIFFWCFLTPVFQNLTPVGADPPPL